MNRLQIEDWFARHPEIDEQDVEIELLGVGFRTGSTALPPDRRGPRSGTSGSGRRRPCPPPGVSAEDDEARKAAARITVDMGQGPHRGALRSMLPQSAAGPMEDHDLMALEFTAQTFLVSAHIPTYADWFATATWSRRTATRSAC